jgi:hypothetical protein
MEISSEAALNLRFQLNKDTNFLQNINIIDYSLLVIKITWGGLKPSNPKFWSKYQRIVS